MDLGATQRSGEQIRREQMGNEMKNYRIDILCNEAFYRALILALRYAMKLCRRGSSRTVAIYVDGDGKDRIAELEPSESVPESEKGIISAEEAQEIERVWVAGDFWIDTDDVFSSIDG